MKKRIIAAILWLIAAGHLVAQNPAPTNPNLDSEANRQQRIQWFREARFGVINSRIRSPRFPSRIPPPLCDYISTGDNEIAEKDLGFEWENPGTMNASYGYNQNDHDWVPAPEIVFRLVEIVSKGGNYLLNVGPTSEGLIPQPSVDRLKEIGEWMRVNQTAIYGTMPWKTHGEGPSFKPTTTSASDAKTAGARQSPVDIRFTAKGKSVFAICLTWPDKEFMIGALGNERSPNIQIAGVKMLGSKEEIHWRQTDAGLSLSVPREKPCRHAFAYRIDLK